jgi:hypothetical protein
MTRRILIAAANPWSLSLAVERQFAREHQSDQVDMVDVFQLVSRFSPHWTPRDRLIERLNRKIPRFIQPAINGSDITPEISLNHSSIPPTPNDVRGLQSYSIGEARVGLGVLSSIYEITSVQHWSAAPADYGGVLEEAWTSAHLSHHLGEQVAARNYDRVYIFGGRHCYSRPFCDVIERAAEMYRYEQGWSGTAYVAAPASIYEPVTLARIIRLFPLDEEAGELFYRERLSRSPTSDATFFTAHQLEGHIPEPLRGKTIVTLFSSSVDEMYGLKDSVRFGDFATQHEAAVALAKICAGRGMTLAIRLHPHLAFKHPSWRGEWDFEELRRLGVHVIQPEAAADTYALARASHCVFSCGSTVGFESTFLSVPNAVIGKWLSGELGASAVASTEAELARFVEQPHLPQDARRQALHFGSVQKLGATPVEGLDPGSHPNFARIDGRIVDPVRYAVQRAREWAAGIVARPIENRSGIIDGRVVLPSGPRYRLH